MAVAAMVLVAACAGPTHAQSLRDWAVSPNPGTSNSVFNYSVIWQWDVNQYPWFDSLAWYGGQGLQLSGPEEVIKVNANTVDIKIPTMYGIENAYQILEVAGQRPGFFQGVDYSEIVTEGFSPWVRQGFRTNLRTIRVTLNSPLPDDYPLPLTARVRVGGFRVVEADITVDPDGDGRTFYTRAAPIVAVTGVFDENGTDYSQAASGGSLEFAPYLGRIVLPEQLPSRVRKVKLIYWVGPIVLIGPAGQFFDSEFNEVPMAAGVFDLDTVVVAPRFGTTYVVSGSQGLNLRYNARSVPGLYSVFTVAGPASSDGWYTYYIERNAANGPRIDTDAESANFGGFVSQVEPDPPPLLADPPAVVASNSIVGNPSVIEKVGPTNGTIVRVTPPAILSQFPGSTSFVPTVSHVNGVWDNPDLEGTNYYTGGSFDSATNTITLGTALPDPSSPVWANYAHTTPDWGDESRTRYGNRAHRSTGADRLFAYPEIPRYSLSEPNPKVQYDPLIAEQYLDDPVNPPLPRDYVQRTDPRQFVPFLSGMRDDGTSSNIFAFRVRYYNSANMSPQPWLLTADGTPGASGVQMYIKYDGAPDFKVYGMAKENPAEVDYDQANTDQVGMGYLLKMEPNAGYGVWTPDPEKSGAPSYWSRPNNYIAMPVGRHQYFFATTDDIIRNRKGDLHPNPLVKVRTPDPMGVLNTPFWLEQVLPLRRVGEPIYDAIEEIFTGTNRRDTFNYVDRTTYQPGVEPFTLSSDPKMWTEINAFGGAAYEFPADRHPVVHALLSGIPFGQAVPVSQHEGSGYFLGTVQPYKRAVNPAFRMPTTGTSTVGSRSRGFQETSGGTSSTTFTFQVIYQSFDPDTKIGRAPVYVKVFINNTSDASGPYSGYSMSPVWPISNPTETQKRQYYKEGLTYQTRLQLPAGPHTYYFEASYGSGGVVRFPVRPNGRQMDAPPDGVNHWVHDFYVPGDSPNGDNNDYCPGPYVNNRPVLSAASVSPTSGAYGTDFVYRVTYTDADNQRPSQTDVLIEVAPGQVVRAQMRKVDPNAVNYSAGVVYEFRASSLQESVLSPGTRRFRFEFADDWGAPDVSNDVIAGESILHPAAVPGVPSWIQGPTVSTAQKPLLNDGSVVSSDGTSNPSTVWTYQVSYTHGSNTPPSYVNVLIGSQRHPEDPLALQTLERVTPDTTTQLRVASVPIVSVTGVWTTQSPTASDVNYFTGGSYNANTGVITLGQTLPESGRDAWVTYAATPITWQPPAQMAKRDPTDLIYTDGAIYQYQTTLPGAQQAADKPIRYFYSFQASDGSLLTQYDSVNSDSAHARTRQVAGEGSSDTGEFLDHAVSVNNTVYTAQHFPIVGPLPDSGTITEPLIWKNETLLDREFTAQLNSSRALDNVQVSPDGTQVTVRPEVVHMVLGVFTDPGGAGTNYYTGGKYNRLSGVIALGTTLPPGMRQVYVDYYNRGDYRIDFPNGKVIFSTPNLVDDTLEMEYWWAQTGPLAVGLNNPPRLSEGRFSPDNAIGVDGSSTTNFAFSVVYTDTDSPTGQAPSFVRVVIDGTAYPMISTAVGNPIYANGVRYTYTTPLSSGSHEYYFEASDGTGFAVWDADQNPNKTSLTVITNIAPLPGPIVNDDPTLSAGLVDPNLAGGMPPGSAVTYRVTYTDPDGDAPSAGSPRVWVDNPQQIDYSGKIINTQANVLTIGGVSWTPGALTGKLLQVTTGLVIDPDSGSVANAGPASGRVFQVVENGTDTITLGVADASSEGINIGDTVSVGWLVMSKSNPAQTNFRQGVQYAVVVSAMPIGSHTYHFTATSAPTNGVVRFPLSGQLIGPTINTTPAGNVRPLLSSGSVTPASGLSSENFVFEVFYADPEGDAAGAHDGVVGFVKVMFDNPAIPDMVMVPVNTPVTNWTSPVLHRVTLTDLPSGTHTFHFEASDGYRTPAQYSRFPVSSAQNLSVSVNARPALTLVSGQGVSPQNGTEDTNFTWRVRYADVDNDAPATGSGAVKVIIIGGEFGLGQAFDMTKETAGTNYATGIIYTFTRKLPNGSYSFRFTASDVQGQAAVAPGVQSGPIVQTLQGPELTSGAVTPESGPGNTQFVYSVRYLDSVLPTSITVHIDGEIAGRSLTNSGIVDGNGRILFESPGITLDGGTHQFHFEASNGQATTRLPATGFFDGPSVTGASLSLNLAFDVLDLGAQINVSGVLAPASLNPASIIVSATRPDGSTVTRNVSTDADGAYSANLGAADVTGQWTIRAVWQGDRGFATQTATKTLTVGGYLIPLIANRVDMVGITLIPSNPSPAVIFGDAQTATRMHIAEWNPAIAQYRMYPNDPVSLTGGDGFWIRPEITETVIAKGQLWAQDTPYNIPLSAGWNQVSSVFVNPIGLGNAQVRYQGQTLSLSEAASRNWIRDYFWGFDPDATGSNRYILVRPGTTRSTLLPARGYWARALVDCELILRP